jgi:hypothetical protein
MILAQPRETLSEEELRRAIKERTTRGLLLHNAGAVAHLEGDFWAVRSSRGGFHHVDLAEETCTCEDYEFFGSKHGVPCKHIFCVAIGLASRRSGVRVIGLPAAIAGDPFAHAARRAHKAEIFDRLLAAPDCERCGAVAVLNTDDGVPLCERCAL